MPNTAYLATVAIELTSGQLGDIRTIDMVEQQADRKEDALQDERVIGGTFAPATLEMEADARLNAIAAGLVSVASCLHHARSIEQQRADAPRRIGAS